MVPLGRGPAQYEVVERLAEEVRERPDGLSGPLDHAVDGLDDVVEGVEDPLHGLRAELHAAGGLCDALDGLLGGVGVMACHDLDEGSVGSEKTDLRLDGMAASVVSRLQDAAAQHDVTLRTDLKPCRVHGIAQIVDELIYERTAVEARVLRDFSPRCTPEQRALIRRRVEAYEALAAMESPDYNKLYEADRALHGTWFAAMDKMYLWSTLQNAHADYSRFRMLDTMTTGGLAEVIADHRNLMNAIERCDLAAFEPLVERHLYGGIRRLGSKLTEEYADYFE